MLLDLASTLGDNPRLATTCGFLPNKSLYSLEERLSCFLKDILNDPIRINLVTQLIQLKEICGNFLSIDSAAVPIVAKENNPKTCMSSWLIEQI